ncbi:sugar transferase [Bradyrhizobium canariense]|uniref:sugar transferase n=1 Tax=Bradyrhizobium canariense TaxID=255045 RepID=UPI001C681D32|nr:sugar transferase [Bradyrhizobium canariense]MBW5435821.1 sugar transferase [Bradyrhizobium canariense]
MKRLFDILVCTAFLLVFWPILLVIIILIRLQSPGPAIFAQVRIGRNAQPFTCYKLRTMYIGTGDLPTHEVQASSVTPLGKYLRRSKIDELPQLCNVLAGQMSLVGPRPCLPSQTTLIEARHRLGVFKVCPGMTGLAQVNDIDMSEPELLAEVDAQYVNSRSLLRDLKLLWATLCGHGMAVDRVARIG